MTALGKLFRTTAFKIVAVYLVVFALFAMAVIGYLARHTQELVVSQITEAIDSEIKNLQDVHADGGIGRLIDVVTARAQQPGSNLYLITSFNGAVLAANVTDIDNATLSRQGWSEISYRRTDDAADSLHDSRALVRVTFIGGFRVLVGRDIEERERLREILATPARWSLVVIVILGLAGGIFVTRRVMKRIDSMTATSEQIMRGDFGGRLAVTGSGDEFDRLANSLNAMLARIENLMGGLKHVSDNIAHDLKTPLTRLRNRAEEALRPNHTETELRRALESTIEESDNLIRTFNALLMISRAEAGEVRKSMIDFDAADVARGVSELYEPVAEERGLTLGIDAPESISVRGSRELVSQAVANLVDNAIKHGGTTAGSKVTVAARKSGDRIEFTVSDRGPGIPEADRLRVLERFVRLEESRSRPGAGLGLSLALAVARLHGGDLRLEDNSPGLKVTLAIPAQPGQTKGGMKAPKTKPAESSETLLAQLREAPRIAKSADAKKAVAALIDEAPKNISAVLGETVASSKILEQLLHGLFEGSPYLWGIISADPAMLLRLLGESPEQGITRILKHYSNATAVAGSDADAQAALRAMKREGALLIALADIGGVWQLDEVTTALTALADTAVRAAVDRLLRAASKDGKIKLPNGSAPGEGSGYIVLAMGKHGAGELNYSSDIDLIVLFEREAAPLTDGVEPVQFFVSLTKSLLRLVHDRTGDGYVFRTDLRLRPDPGSTQIALSTTAALDYYEREGQTWERAAHIKARPIAGDIAAGEKFLKNLSPFVWRRYLDHAAIADVHAMKRQIHAFRGHDEIAVAGHNIKLGRGGIREIEFFVQTQQLIAGGRVPELRGRRTLEMLARLAEEKWIDEAARDELRDAYLYLRRVEHRLQMIADEQTHILPEEDAALDRFARFLGLKDRGELARTLTRHLQKVQSHYAHLFEDAPPLAAVSGALLFPKDKDDRETLDTLAKLGFKEPLAASHLIRGWFTGEYRALKTETAQGEFQAILPALLDALSRSGNPDAALLACDRFLSQLPGGERLLAAMRTHPDLVQLIATILSTSPRLRDMIAQAPSLLDGLLDPAFFAGVPSEELLTKRLGDILKQARSEEDFLDLARSFGREHLVLIGVRVISGALSASRAGEAYATLADVIIRELHHEVTRRFEENHGKIAKAETAVVALGKLGSREMTAGSDLDLILLYEFDETKPESNGKRPLYGAQYFARLTQRVISSLTTPTNMGKLYDVDLRLRPSGRSGPVATSLASFVSYQRDEAWTWEHMALTRARVVSASAGFRKKVETAVRKAMRADRDPGIIARDVLEMRQAIADERGDGERWDIKNAKGGLVDIEFLAQYFSLVYAKMHPDILDTQTARVIEKARKLSLLDKADGELLSGAVTLYHNLTQILRLCVNGPFEPAKATPGLLALLARAGSLPDFATLNAHLAETEANVREAFERILNGAAET